MSERKADQSVTTANLQNFGEILKEEHKASISYFKAWGKYTEKSSLFQKVVDYEYKVNLCELNRPLIS